MKVTATKAEVTALVAEQLEAGAEVTLVASTGKAKEAVKPAVTESVIASDIGAPAKKARVAKDVAPAAEAFVGPLPALSTKPAAAKAPAIGTYMLTEMAEKVVGKNTLQRSAAGQGKEWRKTGKVDTSIRYQALAAIAAVADEEGCITRSAALAALANVELGCSSPAVRLAKFVRSGHLAEA